LGVKLIAEVERLDDEINRLCDVVFDEEKKVESLTKERDEAKLAEDYGEFLDQRYKIEKLEAENAELRTQTGSYLLQLAATEKELKSVVIEINSIKEERNAVIKAHADLLAECQELKTQLKFLEARLEK